MAVKINLRLLPTMLVVFLITAGCSTKPKGPVEVRINANEFSFESSLREFETGVIYRFTVTNAGKLAHEIMIVPLTESDMLMDMEQIDQTALAMIPEDDLPAGATQIFEYTFTKPAASGELEFACHVPGHYEAGMKLPIVVK